MPTIPPAIFFFQRDRRDVNDSVAERNTVWQRRSVVGTGEELAFSGNFPVAPCANIYREYRDLRDSLYARVQSRCSTRIRTHSYVYTGAIAVRAEAAVCIGESCEYMHKNVCFRVPAPSPSVSSLLSDPFSYPSAADSRACMPTYHDHDVDDDNARVHGAKMSSDLERASRMLTFPARRGMITLMTYIGGWQCNHVSPPPPFYPRERQSMRMLAKRTTNFVFGYRFV